VSRLHPGHSTETSVLKELFMKRTLLIPALAVVLALGISSRAHAYGASRTAHTSVSSNGTVQHSSSGSASGPYGSVQHSGSTTAGAGGVQHTGTTTATGAYGGTYDHTASRTYSPSTYNGYSAAGVSGGRVAVATAPVQPTGVYARGYTAVGYDGSVQHTGSTTVAAGGVQHTGTTTATGAYGGTYDRTSSRTYSPGTYNGYSAAGASGHGYSASVTRSGSISR
jgi:hypothetical protein